MNILSGQEMREAEISLLKITLKESYLLVLPQERQYQHVNTFQGSLFPHSSALGQKAVEQMVTLTDNLRGLKQNHSNSLFHMLTYSLMAILYQDKCRSSAGGDTPHYLLQSIKCSLYSPDIDFTCIRNVDFSVETEQMKAMGASFLNFMQKPQLKLGVNRMRCVQWIFQHNPILLHIFIMLFRFILLRLQIDEANNYRTMMNLEQSIVNLIEYFDLSYRSLNELFLFYNDAVFLAVVEKEIVVGDYFQNQKEKEQLENKLEGKNMVQSYQLNVDPQASFITPQKNGIADSDAKLLNFMLDSGCEEVIVRERETDLETPHFMDNSQQFNFGKKRRESKAEEVKHQIEKLIMDELDGGLESEDFDQGALTPSLGGSQRYSLAVRSPSQPVSRLHTLDSPADELYSIQNVMIGHGDHERRNYVAQSSLRTNTENGQKIELVHTPQSTGAGVTSHDMGFSWGNPDHFCRFGEKNKEKKDNDLSELISCRCRRIRLQRNTMSSKVVEVYFIPQAAKKAHLSSITSPKFLNFKPITCRRLISDVNIPNQDKDKGNAKTLVSPSKLNVKQSMDRKPAFLKNLKKHKEHGKQSIKYSKSIVTDPTLTRSELFNQPNPAQSHSMFKKYSTIVSQEPNHLSNKQKECDFRGIKSFSYGLSTQYRFDDSYVKRGGLGRSEHMWQPNSNLHHTTPQYSQLNRMNSTYLSNQNSPNGQNNPYKFYAPVQIIAPTVYVNSSGNNGNDIIFKVGEYAEGKHSANPQAKREGKEQMHGDQNIEQYESGGGGTGRSWPAKLI